MATDKFKVYSSGHLLGVGRALAIITVTSEDELKWNAESFIFLPKFHEDSVSEIVPWDAKDIPTDIPEDLFCLDENFMFREGLLRANARLNGAFEAKGTASVGMGINLGEVPNQELIQLLRQKKKVFVEGVQEKTISSTLKRYLKIILAICSG